MAWGNAFYGQCSCPTGLSNVVAIAAGEFHSLALTRDGTVVTWGDNRNGQCSGPAVTNASAIAAGTYFTLATKRDGSVVAFGDNSCGQTNVPAAVTSSTSIAGGTCFSLAARIDGSVISWGSGSLPTLSNVISVAAGRAHGLALIGTRTAALSIEHQNGTANLGWSDTAFQLQTTTNVLDATSWQTVLTSTNAYATTPFDKARFFRLIKN